MKMIKYHKPPFRLKEFKIEVTQKCSLACIHCSSDARPDARLELSIDDCISILEQARKLGAKEVSFSGGEPLLWPNILDAVTRAKELGFLVNIYTSGNVTKFKSIFNNVPRDTIKSCIFSIFGGDEKSHERVTRIKGSFNKTKAAIKSAINLNISTEFHFVPMSFNCKQLEKIALLSKEWGVARISILRFVPQGRATLISGEALSQGENIFLKKTILNLRDRGFNIRTGSPLNFLMVNDRPACCSGIDRMIIAPDLNIYPCDAFKNVSAEEIVGTSEYSNLGSKKLSVCWNKSPYLKAIREYLTTDFGPPCSSCPDLEGCLSGCLAQKVLKYGDLKKRPDPMCLRRYKK